MAEEPGEQSQSLFRPPMSDPELNLECRGSAKPKVLGPLTTQTIQEEARAASTEQRALQLRGTDFYLPLGGQPRISEKVLEVQGLSVPIACVGSGDPVRVLRLYTTNTLDEV